MACKTIRNYNTCYLCIISLKLFHGKAKNPRRKKGRKRKDEKHWKVRGKKNNMRKERWTKKKSDRK
jgi:hypothetical protein